jgi:Domain of unknown function (DUF4349)
MACARQPLLLRGALTLTLTLTLAYGCAAPRRSADPVNLPSLPRRPSFVYPTAPTGDGISFADSVLVGAPAARQSGGASGGLRAVSRAVSGSLFASRAGAARAALTAPAVAPGVAHPAGERIELEAQLAVAVAEPRAAAARLRAILAAMKGEVAADEEYVTEHQTRVQLLVRVPTSEWDAFAARVAELGRVEQRVVKMVDAGLEERDLDAIVTNLEDALAHYKALLAKATTPADTLAAEREIERASSDLDRVKARLAWLRDRIARATVALTLQAPSPPKEDAIPVPYLMAGARPIALLDITDSGTLAYLGGGLTLRWPHATGDSGRGLSVDVDVLRACCGSLPARTPSGFMVLGGWDLSSVDLSYSARRWMIPYVGGRLGFSQLRDRSDFVAGAVAGIDVFRAASFVVGAQARFLLLVGNPDGPHGGIEPALTADVGF